MLWGDPHETLGQTEAFGQATIEGDPATTCELVVERRSTVFGKAGLWRTPEIGLFIHPAHQRQGLGREAHTDVFVHFFVA